MTGYDGAVDFMMVESVKYHVTVVKAGEINTAIDVYPVDSAYNVWASPFATGQWYEQGYNVLVVINFTADSHEVNSSFGVVNFTYLDSLGGTSYAFVWVNKSLGVVNGTELEQEVGNYTAAAGGNFSSSIWILNHRGNSYRIRVNATTTAFGFVYRTGPFSFPPGPLQVGDIPESWHIFIAMVALMMTAMTIPLTGIVPGLWVWCFEGWIWFGIGWLNDLHPNAYIRATALGLATIATLFYTFSQKNAGVLG